MCQKSVICQLPAGLAIFSRCCISRTIPFQVKTRVAWSTDGEPWSHPSNEIPKTVRPRERRENNQTQVTIHPRNPYQTKPDQIEFQFVLIGECSQDQAYGILSSRCGSMMFKIKGPEAKEQQRLTLYLTFWCFLCWQDCMIIWST